MRRSGAFFQAQPPGGPTVGKNWSTFKVFAAIVAVMLATAAAVKLIELVAGP